MSMSWRVAGVLLGVVFLSAGCDKSSTTPGKPGDETYAKKLVGVWEGTDELGPMTVEFKADNSATMSVGPKDKDPLVLTGTWKLVKEEGKTVTFETEVAPNFPDAKQKLPPSKKSWTATFDDADNITMSPADKNDPKKLKRKS